MATQVKSAANDLHEEDFFVWSQRQAKLLRERRFDELDLTNLIEEVEDLGGALERSVRSRARTIMETSAQATVLAGARSAPGPARHNPNPAK